MIIAIDGPAGSGKSTVAKILARRLGFLYIDTGAMYRAFTLKVIKKGLDFRDKESINRLLKDTKIELVEDKDKNLKVLLDGEDVSDQIRLPQVSEKIFYVADDPQVRKIMVAWQREMGKKRDCVIEGRDTTTVIFPDADIKIYLDADFKVRVKRRYKDFLEKNVKISLQEVEKKLRQRDEKDFSRPVGALKRVEDAVYIDSTNLSIEEVCGKILSLLEKACRKSS